MTGRRPPVLGYTIRCSMPDCGEETARQAPSRSWDTPDRAVRAAKLLGWVHGPGPTGRPAWFCPLHQAWDPSALRWVPTRREAAS